NFRKVLMNNVMTLAPSEKVKIHSGHLKGWGQTTQAMTHLYMKMLTNRNALIVKLNLITMPEQTIKVSECQPTTVWRIVVLFTKQRQQLLASRECDIYRSGKDLFNLSLPPLRQKIRIRS